MLIGGINVEKKIDIQRLDFLYYAFPTSLKKDLEEVLRKISKVVRKQQSIYFGEFTSYKIDEETLMIPCRIYFRELPERTIKNMSDLQKQAVFCIYSRHHNGHVREKYINKLLEIKFSIWCIPYILKISDEYVEPIISLINNKLTQENELIIREVCMKNTNTLCLSFNRMISYWNEFYRNQTPNINDYVGMKLYTRIGFNQRFVNKHMRDMNQYKQILDMKINQLKIVIVGKSYIDMITPYDSIDEFIKTLNSLNIQILGFTWWCHVKENHEPCGLGGPLDFDKDGYYSEIQMNNISKLGQDLDVVSCNEAYLKFFLDEYPHTKEYKKCYLPGFWIDCPSNWKKRKKFETESGSTANPK